MRVRLHPEARAELREARRWYYERSPLSATAFAHAVDNAVSRTLEAPTQYPFAEHGTRKLVLQRFPFNIFYLPSAFRNCDRCGGTSETAAGLLVHSHESLGGTLRTQLRLFTGGIMDLQFNASVQLLFQASRVSPST